MQCHRYFLKLGRILKPSATDENYGDASFYFITVTPQFIRILKHSNPLSTSIKQLIARQNLTDVALSDIPHLLPFPRLLYGMSRRVALARSLTEFLGFHGCLEFALFSPSTARREALFSYCGILKNRPSSCAPCPANGL
jgi:hypothetical protein